ncbi:MAG: Calx-beta domain-containing protein [Myxococcota bacterium]|nr:Calx-beta domain-containing protein [Myxococcota bacterium]
MDRTNPCALAVRALGAALLAGALSLPSTARAGAIFLLDNDLELMELPREGASQSFVAGQNHAGFLAGGVIEFGLTTGVWVPSPCPPDCDPPDYDFVPFPPPPPGAGDNPTSISNTSPDGWIGVSGFRFDGVANVPTVTRFPANDPASAITTLLPVPPGFSHAFATDVNRNLDVVGFGEDSTGTPQAIFWTEEGGQYQPTLLDALDAPAISDAGPVVVNRTGGAGMFLDPAADPSLFQPLGTGLVDLTLSAISEPAPDTGEGGVWVLGSTRDFSAPGSPDTDAVVIDPGDPDVILRVQSTPSAFGLDIGPFGQMAIVQGFPGAPRVSYSALGLDPSADPACTKDAAVDLPSCDLTQVLGVPNQPGLRFVAATQVSHDGVIGLNSEAFVAQVAFPTGPRVRIGDASIAEGDDGDAELLVFPVSLDRPARQEVVVTFSTADGTATAASDDYVTTSGGVLIPAGSTNATIEVQIVGDELVETNESLFVDLISATNAVIVDPTGLGTIVDDDCTDSDLDGVCDVNDNCVLIPNPDQQNLDGAADDDASKPGLQIYGDDCDLDIDNDGLVSASDFFLGFRPCLLDSNAFSYCGVFDADGNGTIAPADFFAAGGFRTSFGAPPGPGLDGPAGPILTVSDGTASEGGDGDANLVVFTVSLDQATDVDVTVRFDTEDGTARVADDDYVQASGTVLIPAGSLSATIEVQLVGDAVLEADETFQVRLQDAVNATIGDGRGNGSITNDDGPKG